MHPTRREFLAGIAAGAGGLMACRFSEVTQLASAGPARLLARPGPPTGTIAPGLNPLALSTEKDGYLYVPAGYVPGHPTPLLLSFHGAGISAQGPINLLSSYAESHGFLLLSVDSGGITWDAITFAYSYDVPFIDQALKRAFERCSVDPVKVFVSGFSDGASYALGIGLANGDLFSRVAAFSPGFIPQTSSPSVGRPEFFLSHGQQDPVLPIDTSSRVLVPYLRGQGYSVSFTEFAGGHTVPPEIALAAVEWLLR